MDEAGMRILLSESESEAWLRNHQPAANIRDGPAAHREEIMQMVANGKYAAEIARKLGLRYASVKDLIYRERNKASDSPIAEVPSDVVVIPSQVAESPVVGPKTDQDRIDEIILLGVTHGAKYTHIAAKIGRIVGGSWTSDDVSRRIKELKGDKP